MVTLTWNNPNIINLLHFSSYMNSKFYYTQDNPISHQHLRQYMILNNQKSPHKNFLSSIKPQTWILARSEKQRKFRWITFYLSIELSISCDKAQIKTMFQRLTGLDKNHFLQKIYWRYLRSCDKDSQQVIM